MSVMAVNHGTNQFFPRDLISLLMRFETLQKPTLGPIRRLSPPSSCPASSRRVGNWSLSPNAWVTHTHTRVLVKPESGTALGHVLVSHPPTIYQNLPSFHRLALGALTRVFTGTVQGHHLGGCKSPRNTCTGHEWGVIDYIMRAALGLTGFATRWWVSLSYEIEDKLAPSRKFMRLKSLF